MSQNSKCFFSVHVADDPFQIVSVHNVRDSDVVNVDCTQLLAAKALDKVPTSGESVILCFKEVTEGFYRAVYFGQ